MDLNFIPIKNTKKRKYIDKWFRNNFQDEPPKGILIVDKGKAGITCRTHVFRRKTSLRTFLPIEEEKYISDIPYKKRKVNDIVIYYRYNDKNPNYSTPLHVGRIIKKSLFTTLIDSKFGNKGPIVFHDINDIPSMYGNVYRIFRRIHLLSKGKQ